MRQRLIVAFVKEKDEKMTEFQTLRCICGHPKWQHHNMHVTSTELTKLCIVRACTVPGCECSDYREV